MSGLVLTEQDFKAKEVLSAKITVKRFNCINLGVRIWFQILSTDGIMYQRWSMVMNPTDEVLILVQPGDILDIQYVKDTAEDKVYETFQKFDRNIIVSALFV